MSTITEETRDTEAGRPTSVAGDSVAPKRRHRPLLIAAALVIVVLAVIAVRALGVSRVPKAAVDAGKPVGVATRSVTAEVRPITSVMVLDASVVANPVFRVPAPRSGKVVKIASGLIGIQASNETTGQPVALPVHSKAESVLVPFETTVTAGLPIINARYTGFALQATVAMEKIYRLYSGIISARAEITNGPGPFDSPVLGVPFVSGGGGYSEPATVGAVSGSPPGQGESTGTGSPDVAAPVADAGQGLVVVAAAPTDIKLLEGLPGLLALKVAEVTDAVTLPVEAVAGISQRGQVYVEQAGKRVLRDVTLGITDGSYIEIKTGISAGDKVLLPAPSIANIK